MRSERRSKRRPPPSRSALDWSYWPRCAYSNGGDVHSPAMVQPERVLWHARGATSAARRVDDRQFALGFESANLRKNRRPPARAGRRSALRLLVFLSR